ncbi:MAG: hypothetical protein UX53_C0052G0004 [Candidatus Azambacteria bacterium GW2011_GWB2_46_37]|uniref:DUF1573 domain-containing protein n=1 Tax=Candidatus Azambacteria bacterium GW2011_GWB2_46_37 TaxID=1618618 RepID=A0A0G1SVS7_9BACT|nr:MAG: hypothetical protein UX53_C0052G0004 [Candidatus Azambacteria bacterium GW2011_GWB2_46_37]
MKNFNNKNIVISVAASILVIGGAVWYAGLKPADNQPAGQNTGGALAAEESSFDFGVISMAAGEVSHSFKSCMCTTAILNKGGNKSGPFGMPGHGSATRLKETIGPGEEAEIEVVFDPAAHGPEGTGLIKRVVYAETDSEAAPKFQLTFEANVTP